MSGFFSAMLEELGARRRRFRQSFGDRGQALAEFLTLAGLFLGSAGLFARPWMPAAAAWGFAVPVVFLIVHLLLEYRRQARTLPADEEGVEAQRTRDDWAAFLWSMACAAAGLAAFVIAWGAEPAAPGADEQGWTPPDGAVSSTIVPGE